MYLKVAYIKNFYSNISRKLKPFNICTVPKINYFMDKIIKRGKVKVEKVYQTNVAYKINCNCCDSYYVGETKRTARIRSGEHKKQSINPLKGTPFFFRHISSTDHSFNFDNPDVSDIEPHYFRRITSELVHINSQKNGINIQKTLKN